MVVLASRFVRFVFFLFAGNRLATKDKRQKDEKGVEKSSLPIITRAGTAFHSSQKVMKELVTKMIPGMKTVVK